MLVLNGIREGGTEGRHRGCELSVSPTTRGGVLAAYVANGVLQLAHAFLDLAGDLIHFAFDLVISHGNTSHFWRRSIATRLKDTRTGLAEPFHPATSRV